MDIDRNADLRIVGGHPALDLINTVAPRQIGQHDHHDYLSTPADLLAWAERIELIDRAGAQTVAHAWAGAPTTAGQALHAARDVREAAYAVLAGAEPGPALDRLSLRWAAAAARSELVPLRDAHAAARLIVGTAPARSELVPHRDAHAAARLIVGTAPAFMIPDRLAHATVELLRTVDLRHLRACPIAEGGCGWLFLDRSRNGSRRWCAMEDCGAQAKARRLTEKRRIDRATSKTR